MTSGPSPSGRKLRQVAVWILVLNAVAAVAAIVLNLPAQFGGVGTDAGAEFLTRGTAISAPLLPTVMLLVVVALAARRDGWGWLGIVVAWLCAATVGVGGVGELLAEPTDDSPRAVLVASGVAWLLIAVVLTAAALRAAMSRGTKETGTTA